MVEEEEGQEDQEGAKGADKGSSTKKLIIIAAAAFILLMSISVGAIVVLLGDDEEEVLDEPAAQTEQKDVKQESDKKEEPAQEVKEAVDIPTDITTKSSFVSIRPGFVVNLKSTGKTRYLQIGVDLMVPDDAKFREIVQEYMPLLQHELNILFADQRYEDLQDNEGRQALNDKALKVVQDIFKEHAGHEIVKKVLFTKVITQ